jgi:hypothetical protein
MEKIKNIINNYFDRDFFWRYYENGSPKLIDIYKRSDEFEQENPDLVNRILGKFHSNFPQYQIKRFRPFIKEDRGINFEVRIDASEVYVIWVSVFDFFLAWKLGNEIPFTSKTYIEQGELNIIDSIYSMVIVPIIDVEWLPRETAYEEIDEFNGAKYSGYLEDDEIFNETVFVVDAIVRT